MSSMFRRLRAAGRQADASDLTGLTSTEREVRGPSQEPGAFLNTFGLHLIHGEPESSADVIFVHGLGGSPRGTWTYDRKPDAFWPAWMRHEEGLSNFRVFSYGYNAKFKEQDNPLSIVDFSKGLLVRMKTYGHAGVDNIGLRPIIFIAHSMGGLVVKKALIIGKGDHHYAEMLSSVYGIMFLATPHRGAAHARTLNTLFALMGIPTKTYMSELETFSTSVEDINEKFRAICSSWHLISLYETLPTKLVLGLRKMIVDKDSGVLDYPAEISAPADADHNTICKFSSRLDPNYILIVNLLRNLTKDVMQPQRPAGIEVQSPRTDEWPAILRHIFGIHDSVRNTVDSNLPRPTQGSCKWLYNQESFQAWFDAANKSHTILWLTGLPGTGKSFLATQTIHHIQEAALCQSHFFIEAQQENRSVTYCLRTIAFQMAIAYPPLAGRLVQKYHHSPFSVATQKFQSIWETVFEDIILQVDFGSTVYWVIDGLDEADTPALLIRHLLQMQSKTAMKLLLLSRPNRELVNLAASRPDSVLVQPISVQHTFEDIQAYIKSEVAKILPKDETLQQHVISQVASRAEGSFLWTRLALASLWDNWHTKADIEMVLSEVPNDMQGLYEQMMENVKSQSPRLQHMAFRILAWAACSFRPLTGRELALALEPEFEGFFDLGETVVQICGQFVRMDNGSITLIHGTARKFLFTVSTEATAARGFGISHDHLAIVCLQHLSQKHWRQALGQVTEEKSATTNRLESTCQMYPFLEYAMKYWAYHFSLSSIDNPELLAILRVFCSRYMLCWLQAMALSGNLDDVPRASQYLRKWLHRKRNVEFHHQAIPNTASELPGAEETGFLAEWIQDLIRVVTKFGSNLVQSPSSIHRIIPCLCPESSIIYRTYVELENPLIAIKGLSDDGWDDKLARLSVGKEKIASVIRCAGKYFLALISQSGTVIVWYIDTCEELRKICHTEWVTMMEVNRKGNLVATGGRHTTRIWDISTGQQLYLIPRSRQSRLVSMSFAQTDNSLLLCHDDNHIMAHDLDTLSETLVYDQSEQGVFGKCPRVMSPSPDHTKLAIGYSGRPVRIWDLTMSPQPTPKVILRSADKDRLEGGDEVFNYAELVRWHPDGSLVYILYQDAVVLVWDLLDDVEQEFTDTGAREMVLNQDGTYLLTSSNDGSISVWSLPKFNLIYRLRSDDFVRDLAFSPDGQRIYDVRGSGCNVWAPDVLVRSNDLEMNEKMGLIDGSATPEAASEPIYADDRSARTSVTALICDDEDEFYCCGRDDGSVSIHNIKTGARVRKVSSHSSFAFIIALGWSQSRRLLASADHSARVIVKRLRIKEDDKWAVYPLLELHAEEAVSQLLFSPDDKFILVSTGTMDQVWDLKEKKEVRKMTCPTKPAGKWVNHPHETSQIVWLELNQLHVYNWATFECLGTAPFQSPVLHEPNTSTSAPLVTMSASLERERLKAAALSNNRQYLVHEISVNRGLSGLPSIRLDVVPTSELKPQTPNTIKRKSLADLSSRMQHLLGICHNRVVFLDHSNWICTSTIGWEMGSPRNHFFLPGDWVNDGDLPLLIANKHGTILCVRNGMVAIVRYSRGL
ncbi:hypothetical protein B0I35DRAFT_439689 [Stachybotrys elegans]|uniref:DUF676 domain-containing protein n=1 Tax=Stachybotrys elegans TaxID=80388 RepID=A0A8K0WNR2_9HYPO|nr:hypothetical protein B0I35DRAFT_439689 [Stachybotrys elegans]